MYIISSVALPFQIAVVDSAKRVHTSVDYSFPGYKEKNAKLVISYQFSLEQVNY